MSVGPLQALVERCAKQLEPVEQQIKVALSHVPVLHQDATGGCMRQASGTGCMSAPRSS